MQRTLNVSTLFLLPIVVTTLVFLLQQTSVSNALASGRASKRRPPSSSKGFGGANKKNNPEKNGSPYTVDSSKTTRRLLDFLEIEECEGLEEYTEIGILNDSNLRGVFAKETIPVGAYICAIPFVTTLLIDETFVEEEKANTNPPKLSPDQPQHGLSFRQNFALDENNNVHYKDYLDCLPQYDDDDPNFDPTPDFWSPDEIRQLEVPSLVEEMLQRKQALQRLANDNENSTTMALEPLQHAAWLVRTRAFTTFKRAITLEGIEGLLQRTVLIPYLDFLNHNQSPNAELQVVETKAYDESFYALVATQRIPQGSQVCIRYGTGQETAIELFAKYGFFTIDEDEHTEDGRLVDLIQDVEWSTTLEQDVKELMELSANDATRRTILTIRTYLKRLLLQSKAT
jgi:hypothetical protein